MFKDKTYFLDMFKDYLVQEGIYMNYIQMERRRFTAAYLLPLRAYFQELVGRFMRSTFKGTLSKHSKSHRRPCKPQKTMQALLKLSVTAHNCLLDEPQEHWCRHLFPAFTKSDDNRTNFVETLNNVLNMGRDEPIYNLLKEISSTLTQWSGNKRKPATNWKRRVKIGWPTKGRRRGWDEGKKRRRVGLQLADCPFLGKKPGIRKPRPKSKNKKSPPRKEQQLHLQGGSGDNSLLQAQKPKTKVQTSSEIHTTIVWPHEVLVRSRNKIIHFRWSPTFGTINLSF
ncbi:hypothetical protein Cgig2_001280 [Carnegiea gigantea]|uniref:Uncharacterized protein n=1 Tax=Carnegiea gigantea TaxID=171969 RepID=A0A9Q1QKR6_9CARY|nr:hypothetical protein Cgig2_001280 [Carnegiea gigantea]